jgi:HSP20 family protein
MAGLIPFNRRRADLMGPGFDDFQNMLDDFFAVGWPFNRSLAGDTFKIDVQDNEKDYVVEAELPGVGKDEIGISLDDGKLKISVSRQESSEKEDKNYVHRERRYSMMERRIYLSEAAPEGVKAKMDNGVLTVTVPKRTKQDSSVRIDIE